MTIRSARGDTTENHFPVGKVIMYIELHLEVEVRTKIACYGTGVTKYGH
jgi:hypothetical protein